MWAMLQSLLGMIRFSHTIFALPFALAGAALAWRHAEFHWYQLVGIVLCMVFARSAAMAFNRLADRRIDALNPRTANRHLPAGLLSPATVWLFTLICGSGFVLTTMIFTIDGNYWPVQLSIPVLTFVALYSYTKRFTALAHFWLGASLMLAPVAAWIAIRGVDQLLIPSILGAAVLCWVAGFDILYACQDVDFDRQARLHSVPAAVGVATSLKLAALCHVGMLICLAALYFAAWPDLGAIYITGVVAVAGLLTYEHWLVKPNDLSRVNQAFFQVNGIISIGLFAVVLLQLAVGT